MQQYKYTRFVVDQTDIRNQEENMNCQEKIFGHIYDILKESETGESSIS